MTVEAYVAIYGEKYRGLISQSLAWLDGSEPKWGLAEPIDRNAYVAGLIAKAERDERAKRAASNGAE